MFAANILVARLAGAVRASWPAIKREAPASFLLGAIAMTLCGAAAYLAGEHTSAVNIGLI